MELHSHRQKLIKSAIGALEHAYVPYSNFRVGAAVLMENDQIFTGCNIENSSYGLTNCAERTAIFKAVSEGYKQVRAIAIVGNTEQPISPCGACRQVLAEFAKEDTPIYLANLKGDYKQFTLAELLPYSFHL